MNDEHSLDNDSIELTLSELELVLGGTAAYDLHSSERTDPNANALDLRGPPPPTPGPAHQIFTGMDQVTHNPAVQDIAHGVNTAVHYAGHAAADFIDVGSEVLAGRAGNYAPIIIEAGDRIADWVRPDGPPPVHPSKK
jgi:hypothetical protein